ncbi:ATP-grasp domain-containing protein [Streptomyces sp. NPDC059837]|uniref:carboxylate--amine ligase n=1 Tax=unclassified Streptomyces TaxID=2593676 RepID=UPI00364812B4
MPSYDTSVPALVLKVGHYPNHHGGLAVVRTLGRVGIKVYGVHEDGLAPAALSRYTTGRVIWPTGAGFQDQLLAGLGALARRIGRPAVLIPIDDHAAMFIADQAAALRTWFLFPDLSASLLRKVNDKAELAGLGVDVPEQTQVTSADQLAEFVATARLPVVAKSAPILLPDGRRTRGTRLIRSREELSRLTVPVLLQEYLADGTDWLFHGYCDTRSECLLAFTGRKLRAYPPRAGETALGRAESQPELEKQARDLLRRIGYQGPVSMDYRLDARDGRFRLLDLNPRLGAIFRLFTTTNGLDVVRAMHLDLTGRPVCAGSVVDQRVVVVESNDVRTAWALLRNGELTPRELWTSWRTASETSWFARDDLLPPLAGLVRALAPARAPRPALPRYAPGRG